MIPSNVADARKAPPAANVSILTLTLKAEMPEPRSPHALQPTDYADMRAQVDELAQRASEAGLSHIAYALEVVGVLLAEAEATSGTRPNTCKT